MNMRPRGAAATARRSGIRPIYEDFKPTFEWKHEEGASILLYHLPGFAKEQLRIIAESNKGILRVRGEQLVTSNRWSRFQEEVVVPEDCNMSEIRAKFEGGILRITMPKNIIEEQSKSRTTLLEPPNNSSSVTRPNVLPKPQRELQDELSSKPTFPTIPETAPARTGADQPSPITGEGESKLHHKMQQEAAYVPPVKPPVGLKQSENNGDYYTSQYVPDYSKSSITKDHKEMKEKREEANPEVEEKHEKYVDALDEDKVNYYELNKNNIFGDSKSVTKEQLLINMGAALLVIVALGTHIYYSYGYSD